MNKTSANELVFQTIFNEAMKRGREAAQACRPTPMMVAQHASPLDDASPIEKSWIVEGGVCGFAWIVIRPATSAFARWLKKQRHGGVGYYGGLEVAISDYGQSMEKKEAHARAMSKYLQSVGIKAYAQSRMD